MPPPEYEGLDDGADAEPTDRAGPELRIPLVPGCIDPCWASAGPCGAPP